MCFFSLHSLGIQSTVHGPAAAASPKTYLEMQNLRSYPRPAESESVFR